MQISVVGFDGFNEIDVFVTLNILNRVQQDDWTVSLAGPAETLTSMNGVRVQRQQSLEYLCKSDAVLFSSGRQTRALVEDENLLQRLVLDPAKQLIGSQCSGALFLQRLNLLSETVACTDKVTAPYLKAAGVAPLPQPFHVSGNIATAGGCLSSPMLAAWVISCLAGEHQAERALGYVAPVGREEAYIESILTEVREQRAKIA